jgi:hypothetical protein
MFALCESMKWNHLPEPGGLYAQDPELLEGFMYIFGARAEHQEAEEKKRDNKPSTPAARPRR